MRRASWSPKRSSADIAGAAPREARPTRFCPACYAANAWSARTCAACGALLETQGGYDERLLWALDHPDGATAIRAAGVLAARRTPGAVEPLGRMAHRRDDPYRAAAAVRALRAFADDARAMDLLAEARNHPSVIVRRAAEPGAVDRGTGGAVR